ncbi:ATP-grasp domain-containing protein [Paraburkholderia sacchari]|uniref:ATP-grasp domain-containing protein n=1 Tax=Paraburkholderia sacchari TaxID=159450 RepID=UPI0005432C6D|nr:ATP-grasp domain-containing protein [Paraburkholderia sacchari]NLP65466.1 ATP-grasp domain-containing protein [Paraburkholderia sacchari]
MRGIIVDGYSSGRFLARQLIDSGVTLIHIQSNREVPDAYRGGFDPGIYKQNIVLEELSNFDRLDFGAIDFVVAGSEPGVFLADRLASHFKVAGNACSSSKLRRNKAEMGKALRRAGIPSAEEVVVLIHGTYPKVPSDWYPVVVKPAESAGGDDVRICNDYGEVVDALEHIFSKTNMFNLPNVEAVVQKKLYGRQFMVNSMTQNGRHKIIEIWEERRIHTADGYSIYDREVLIPSNFPESRAIQDYVMRVLTALDLTYGPAHTELFLTEKGPILLETAARIQGGIDGKASEFALGQSQISCTRNLLTDPDWFDSQLKNEYAPRANLMLVNLISYNAGVVKFSHVKDTIAKLPSFHSSFGILLPGAPIAKTVNLLSKPGHVYLVNADIAQLECDYDAIRRLEKNGLIYELENEF